MRFVERVFRNPLGAVPPSRLGDCGRFQFRRRDLTGVPDALT
jgi:hypothetical protein